MIKKFYEYNINLDLVDDTKSDNQLVNVDKHKKFIQQNFSLFIGSEQNDGKFPEKLCQILFKGYNLNDTQDRYPLVDVEVHTSSDLSKEGERISVKSSVQSSNREMTLNSTRGIRLETLFNYIILESGNIFKLKNVISETLNDKEYLKELIFNFYYIKIEKILKTNFKSVNKEESKFFPINKISTKIENSILYNIDLNLNIFKLEFNNQIAWMEIDEIVKKAKGEINIIEKSENVIESFYNFYKKESINHYKDWINLIIILYKTIVDSKPKGFSNRIVDFMNMMDDPAEIHIEKLKNDILNKLKTPISLAVIYINKGKERKNYFLGNTNKLKNGLKYSPEAETACLNIEKSKSIPSGELFLKFLDNFFESKSVNKKKKKESQSTDDINTEVISKNPFNGDYYLNAKTITSKIFLGEWNKITISIPRKNQIQSTSNNKYYNILKNNIAFLDIDDDREKEIVEIINNILVELKDKPYKIDRFKDLVSSIQDDEEY
jgi:hypothetical protein